MEYIYLTLVIFLFILAVSDLVVGVSNDAVNFLNSAIGAKVAPFRVIMFIAALGVLFGATFSSGMMEVARKGIFHPSMFYFDEIMIIFLAVMITDILLLDLFNTFGLPTSTTVSIVFELLGAAVAVSAIKLYHDVDGVKNLGDYINSGKALAIISGILLSVVIAFAIGAIVQYLSRILFTFNYKKTLKRFGSLWGGIAISAITYFILVKGAKGASFMTESTVNFISQNTFLIIVLSFVAWTILLQILVWLFRVNVLKVIVLIGTFALAMAFAGNDLVNFIGVPLAGLTSFQEFMANPGADPNMFIMSALQQPVETPTILLLAAGMIMVLTLWFNKKARSVVKTTIDLSRQNEGGERFGSTALSRNLVRGSIKTSNFFHFLIPEKLRNKIEKRFNPPPVTSNIKSADRPSFDLVRASVNLVVASVLISFATSLTLPLSTTYVTFMVAMGTSLSDRAWGRESAVYRITGVISVIGGWFLTAISAFTVAFIMALIFSWGGIITVSIMLVFAVFLIIKTHTIHKKRTTEEKQKESAEEANPDIIETCKNIVTESFTEISNAYTKSITGLNEENLKKLRSNNKEVTELIHTLQRHRDLMYSTLKKLKDDSIESGPLYVQVLDYLREIGYATSFIAKPILDHVDNNHKGMISSQKEELNNLEIKFSNFIQEVNNDIVQNNFENLDEVFNIQKELLDLISYYRKNQIRRIKGGDTGTKNSVLFLNIIQETKNITLFSGNLLKSFKNFVNINNKNKN
jgi:phosphate/sulfate permease